ncbi:protein TIFY 4B-like isoform X1 [Vitis riparia]|uniref:protein TIFY 4B-like isoform X1 n=1 Tax=Vitis riparia TaxID=96939 RepID=UPI00155B0349|nr:protein TIFY 4B-like isoform X1 [Vitis riparia]
MNPGVTTLRSILDKPLHELTEEDISQLTREDCRKYLKEKGMRRPSWNKSQAIQQVISLKSLLETSEGSGAGVLRKIIDSPLPGNPPPVTSNSADSGKELSADIQISVSADELVPLPPKDHHPESTPSGELASQPPEADTKHTSPRSPGATNCLVGQMTIFYCGKVNVYDGVPDDKAQAIMHLAASPFHLPSDDPFSGAAMLCSSPCHLHTANVKHGHIPPRAMVSQTMQTEKFTEYSQQYREEVNFTRGHDVEGQVDRKLSLQRYFEKRKDRFKSRKKIGLPSGSLEMYVNHQARTQPSNGQSSRSGTSSPPQHGLLHTLCSSADNHTKNFTPFVDLNSKDIQES